MSISYEEALSTLTSMFGPPWNEQTLDAVLRHHEGHMENTVESVLSHGQGNPQDLLNKLHNSQDSTVNQAVLDEQLARQLANEQEQETSNRGSAGSTSIPARDTNPPQSSPAPPKPPAKKGRGTPTDLPPDFLRIPGYTNAGDVDGDEALARMLQDELFTQELKNNPEFAHLARGTNNSSLAVNRASAHRGLGYPGVRGGEGPGLVEALSELGVNAKRRLALLGARFNKNRNNQTDEGTGGLGGSSGMTERRGLLDDEEQVSFVQGQDSVEMRSISTPGGFGSKKRD